MDPIGLSLSVTGMAFSSISAAVNLAKLGCNIKDAPESAKTFIRLIARVQKDVEHALRCRIDCEQALDDCPPAYERWITDTISDALDALRHIGSALQEHRKEDPLPSSLVVVLVKTTDEELNRLRNRLMFVLRDQARLQGLEMSLRYSHDALLTAISAMYTIIFRPGKGEFDAEQISRANSETRFYSRQPIRSSRLVDSGQAFCANDAKSSDDQGPTFSVGTGRTTVEMGTWTHSKSFGHRYPK